MAAAIPDSAALPERVMASAPLRVVKALIPFTEEHARPPGHRILGVVQRHSGIPASNHPIVRSRARASSFAVLSEQLFRQRPRPTCGGSCGQERSSIRAFSCEITPMTSLAAVIDSACAADVTNKYGLPPANHDRLVRDW